MRFRFVQIDTGSPELLFRSPSAHAPRRTRSQPVYAHTARPPDRSASPTAPTITTRQFVQLIEKELGRPVKVRVAGRTMVSLLGLFVPEIREMKEMAYEFTEPYVVEDSKFTQTFGAQTTTHEVAIRETIAWYRQHLHG